MFVRTQACVNIGCFAVLLSFAGSSAFAQVPGKVPREVIEQAAVYGSALVLVGLNVPWQRESTLTEDGVRVQRKAIDSIQGSLLTELAGPNRKVSEGWTA